MFFVVPSQLQYFSTWSTYGHLGQAAIQCIHQPEDSLVPWTTCCWGHTRLNKTSASMLTPPKRIKWKYQVQLLFWFCLTVPMVWKKLVCTGWTKAGEGKINLFFFCFVDVEEDTTPQKGGCWWEWGWPAGWGCEADEADEDVGMMRIRRMNRTPDESLQWTLKGTLRPPKKKIDLIT